MAAMGESNTAQNVHAYCSIMPSANSAHISEATQTLLI